MFYILQGKWNNRKPDETPSIHKIRGLTGLKDLFYLFIKFLTSFAESALL